MRTLLPGLLLVLVVVSGCLVGNETAAPSTSAPPAKAADPLPARLQWKAVADAPTSRAEHCAGLVNDKFYVVGGFIIVSVVPAPVPTSKLEIYDPAADRWTTGPDYPAMQVDHCLAVGWDGKLFVFNDGGSYKFDPAAGAWAPIHQAPHDHNSGVAEAVGDRIYVTGGGSAEVDVYDPAAGAWSSGGPAMPTPRGHTSGAVADGRLFVVAGDVGGHSQNTDANERYDPATSNWTRLAPIPVKRGSVHAVEFHGRILVLGGQNGGDGVPAFDDVNAYDPTADTWSELPKMMEGRHGFAAGAWNGKVYVFAGAPLQGITGTTQCMVMGPA